MSGGLDSSVVALLLKQQGYEVIGVTGKMLDTPCTIEVCNNAKAVADKLEIEHLGWIRGRSFSNAIIMCSEAENLTKQHVQLLIGRVGKGSNLWLDGDFKQVDSKIFEENNGLRIAIEKLKGNKLFGYVNLEKSERSETAALADLLDE